MVDPFRRIVFTEAHGDATLDFYTRILDQIEHSSESEARLENDEKRIVSCEDGRRSCENAFHTPEAWYK